MKRLADPVEGRPRGRFGASSMSANFNHVNVSKEVVSRLVAGFGSIFNRGVTGIVDVGEDSGVGVGGFVLGFDGVGGDCEGLHGGFLRLLPGSLPVTANYRHPAIDASIIYRHLEINPPKAPHSYPRP